MLKHRHAQRQGRKVRPVVREPRTNLRSGAAPRRGVSHVDPGVLILARPQPAGDPRPQVRPGRVRAVPLALILTLVGVVVVGGPGLGVQRGRSSHMSRFAPDLPVVVPAVPGADLLYWG